MKHKTIALFGIVVLLLVATVVAAGEGIPMILINKLDEIKTAIEGLSLSSEVNVYPNYTPDVTVTNEVPVPNVTVNNVISDGDECKPALATENIEVMNHIDDVLGGTAPSDRFKYAGYGVFIFTFPKYPFKENSVTVKKAFIQFERSIYKEYVKVNNYNICYNDVSDHNRYNICPIDPSYLNPGINNVTTGTTRRISIAVEYEYTPANC